MTATAQVWLVREGKAGGQSPSAMSDLVYYLAVSYPCLAL